MKNIKLNIQIDDSVYGLLEEGLAQNPKRPSVPELFLSFIRQGVGQAVMTMAQSKVSVSSSAVATVVEGTQEVGGPPKVLEIAKK